MPTATRHRTSSRKNTKTVDYYVNLARRIQGDYIQKLGELLRDADTQFARNSSQYDELMARLDFIPNDDLKAAVYIADGKIAAESFNNAVKNSTIIAAYDKGVEDDVRLIGENGKVDIHREGKDCQDYWNNLTAEEQVRTFTSNGLLNNEEQRKALGETKPPKKPITLPTNFSFDGVTLVFTGEDRNYRVDFPALWQYLRKNGIIAEDVECKLNIIPIA